jgi:hypothetical protein
MCKRVHVVYPLFFSDFSETWIFFTDLREKAQISSFFKIRQVRAELFHTDIETDRQTDLTKLIVAFRISANAPKKE